MPLLDYVILAKDDVLRWAESICKRPHMHAQSAESLEDMILLLLSPLWDAWGKAGGGVDINMAFRTFLKKRNLDGMPVLSPQITDGPTKMARVADILLQFIEELKSGKLD